jgi:hypothetical protein
VGSGPGNVRIFSEWPDGAKIVGFGGISMRVTSPVTRHVSEKVLALAGLLWRKERVIGPFVQAPQPKDLSQEIAAEVEEPAQSEGHEDGSTFGAFDVD